MRGQLRDYPPHPRPPVESWTPSPQIIRPIDNLFEADPIALQPAYQPAFLPRFLNFSSLYFSPHSPSRKP